MTRVARFALLLLAFAAAGCRSSEPRALVAGEDTCAYCRMSITDERFGAQVVTGTGKIHTFDSIECLAGFVVTLASETRVAGVYVTDFADPGTFVAAEQAVYIIDGHVDSPMGRRLIGFAADADTTALRATYGGRVLSWPAVLREINEADAREHDHGAPAAPVDAAGDTLLYVGPNAPAPRARTLADAIDRVTRGGTIRVLPGLYRESTLVIQRPMRLEGQPGAVLDGEGRHGLLVINADSVSVRGFTFRHTGSSQTEDRSAVRVLESAVCDLSDNTFEDTFFAIHLQRVDGCLVRGNTLAGMAGTQSSTGNGVHLWSSRDVLVEDNVITGHRDGIYFEFTRDAVARRNTVSESLRYGLHFMFSDSCTYDANTFTANRAGVAVMYAQHVAITGNVFTKARGSAAYGLLLKDISDSRITGNAFTENTIALHLEGSNRNDVAGNLFEGNGWALRLLADAQENMVRDNSFARNLFDVGTNSRQHYSTVRGNHWDRYRGYDLDRDGTGDVPHAPVRLFALVVEKAPAALLLVRSIVADALDLAERIAPVLTPVTLVDEAPRMRAVPVEPAGPAAARLQAAS